MLKPTVASLSLLESLAGASIPEEEWGNGDDLCDCKIQRIGMWANPYIAETKKIRFCCIWNELEEMFPGYVQEIPAYQDMDTDEYTVTPQAWDSSDGNMPRALWYRQLSKLERLPLDAIREKYKNERPPQRVRKAGV